MLMIEPPLSATRPTSFCVRKKTPLNVTPDEPVEVVLADRVERLGDLRAGVVDEEVEGLAAPRVSQRVGDAGDERVERVDRAGVELQRYGLAPQRGDLVDHGRGLVGVRAVGDDDVDAVAGERECGGAPDAAVGAGDECDAR